MATYTLRVSGSPIADARSVLAGTDGVSVKEGGDVVVVSVSAPSLEEARNKVEAALPSGGSFSIGRPAALEDEDDD